MTLLAVVEVDLQRGRSLLVATDSVLSCGYRWKRGPKLFELGAACVMAFEGDTQIAYPLLINARNFIDFSDNLSLATAEPLGIFDRVRMDVSEAYDHLVQSRYFDPTNTTCSLVLAGWSQRVPGPVVWSLQPPPAGSPAGTEWSRADIVAGTQWRPHQCFFAGNGDNDPVGEAWRELATNVHQGARFPGYAAFLARVQDNNETAVDGAPQLAIVGPGRREIAGVRDAQGRRYLLGHLVQSGAQEVTYHDEALASLV